MKAQSYGKYDVFEDETAVTWEQAEAMALKARGVKDVTIPPTPPAAAKAVKEREKIQSGESNAVHKLFRKDKRHDPDAETPASAPKEEAAPKKYEDIVMGPFDEARTLERELLNRALILLIHLREKVFEKDPQIETWVNEILEGAHEAKTKQAAS